MNGGPDEVVPTSGDSQEPRAEAPPTLASRFRAIPRGDRLALVALGVAFVALMTYLGDLRYANFFTANWDLGINQQLLWTTAHGRLLYETGDVEFYNVRSFLQVHSTYIAVLVAPVYAAAPTPTTLFVLQSGAFFASVVPLYLLARRLIQNRVLLFLVIGLYLASFPVVSALLYDFHWESFIPLEFLSFFYLYRDRRYLASLVPLTFGLLTLEVFPLLVGGVAVLVLAERISETGVGPKALLHDPDARRAGLLLLGMGIAYVVVRLVEYLVIPGLAGASPTGSQLSSGISGPFAVNVTVQSLGLSATYWALMLAAFAFLPLFAPRYLILTIPWFVYSVFLTPFFASQYGNQYALVAVATLSVALVYGAAQVARSGPRPRDRGLDLGILGLAGAALLIAATFWSPELLSRNLPLGLRLVIAILGFAVLAVVARHRLAGQPPAAQRSEISLWKRRGVRSTLLGVILVGFVAFNLVMSPLNTANFGATEYPGYMLRFTTNPASSEMGWLTGKIPADSVVLASDFLFPYVANNPHAWAMPWFPLVQGQPPLYFPFDQQNLPRFVLIDEADWTNFPCWLTNALLNSSVYGLVAYVYSTGYLGTISLYELGYFGSPQVRYAEPYITVRYYTANNLSVGQSGAVSSNPEAKFGVVISTNPVTYPSAEGALQTESGACVTADPGLTASQGPIASPMWFGPYVYLPAGTYVITANFTGSLLPGGNATLPILTMTGGPYFAPPLYEITVNATRLNGTRWTEITWEIDSTVAYPLTEFRGYLDYDNGRPNGIITLNYIEVAG